MVFEAPPGLKQNIQRTYAFWSSDFLAGHVASATARRSSSGEDSVRASGGLARPAPAALVPLRAQMLFMLAWFNAVLQERQNYVPIVSERCSPLFAGQFEMAHLQLLIAWNKYGSGLKIVPMSGKAGSVLTQSNGPWFGLTF